MKDSLERRLEVSRSLGWPVLCVSMWLCVCVCGCVHDDAKPIQCHVGM